MEDVFNGVPPTIEEAPKRKREYYGGIPDGHIDIFDDRKTMLEWATGKRGKSAAKKAYRKTQEEEQ